jgi:all-trans-retinol 13,14-reductase
MVQRELHQSYKRYKQGNKQFDAIIIGSGISAMTLGSVLSKEGKKVLLLEKHYTPGGFTHTFKRGEWEWDVGVHYLGGIDDEKNFLRKAYDFICESPIEFADMGEVYDTVFFGTDKYEFLKGKEQYKKRLIEYFPGEEKKIEAYIKLIFSVQKKNIPYIVWKVIPAPIRFILTPFLLKPFLKYAGRTTNEVMEQLGVSPKLKSVLCSRFGDYGLAPKFSSFGIHALVDTHYMNGGFYPAGGSSVFFQKIAPVIINAGGEILVRAEVEKILHAGGKVQGVKMTDGKEFYAPSVISSAGIQVTYEVLLKDPEILHKKFGELKSSIAHFCLYIGLDGSAEELQLPRSNFWIFPSYDYEDKLSHFPSSKTTEGMAFISFPSAKDPGYALRHPERSTIEVISFGNFDEVISWQDKPWQKRGNDYEVFKQQLSSKLEKLLYTYVPQVKGRVIYKELSTPLSTRHFANYSRGEMYGLEHSPARFRNKNLRPDTHIKGFFLTGQDITSCGVTGGLMAGLLTANVILKKNIIKKIEKQL